MLRRKQSPDSELDIILHQVTESWTFLRLKTNIISLYKRWKKICPFINFKNMREKLVVLLLVLPSPQPFLELKSWIWNGRWSCGCRLLGNLIVWASKIKTTLCNSNHFCSATSKLWVGGNHYQLWDLAESNKQRQSCSAVSRDWCQDFCTNQPVKASQLGGVVAESLAKIVFLLASGFSVSPSLICALDVHPPQPLANVWSCNSC